MKIICDKLIPWDGIIDAFDDQKIDSRRGAQLAKCGVRRDEQIARCGARRGKRVVVCGVRRGVEMVSSS